MLDKSICSCVIAFQYLLKHIVKIDVQVYSARSNNVKDTITYNNNKHRNAAIPFFFVIAISLFMSLQRSFLYDMYHNTLKYGTSYYAVNIRRRCAKVPIGYCFVYL